ncbi:hypothetical protein FOZ60_013070 [Perkinsus olseni]|uniref:Lysophosphatidic acid phosphatase type 6 n=1 Tax=Perkinsus olseni TaxID=32597 RepID=A0A7J6P9N6_PEROL|nr:hypothetical protein FOZ60_013070 [Perkinsus olseni]
MKAAVLSLLGVLSAVAAYRFPEEDPTYYCHPELKWDEAPAREDGAEAKLERVLVFARHGTRALVNDMTCWVGDETKYTCPTQTFYGFTNSPSGGRSPGFTRIRGKRGVLAGGSCVLGQLVDSGVQMHLANGKQLGVAYRAALGLDDIPKEPEVMFRSTDVARVYQSVEALAMGMFPEIVNEDASNLKIIIPDVQRDSMMPSPKVCPRLKDALREFYESPEAKERVQQSSTERAFIGLTTGRPEDFSTNNPSDMMTLFASLFDCLSSHVCSTVDSEPKNVPLGLGINSPLFKRVQEEGLYWLNNVYGTSEKMRKVAYGPLIKDVLDDLNTPERRLSVYVGHDTGPVNPLADTLRLTWMDSGNRCASILPPFGAMLMMEIYTDKKVRFIYNGRVASVENIKECSGKALCSYEAIVQFLKSLVPSKRECRGTKIKYE